MELNDNEFSLATARKNSSVAKSIHGPRQDCVTCDNNKQEPISVQEVSQ